MVKLISINRRRVKRKTSISKLISSVFLSLTLILGLFTTLIPTPAKALSGINGTAPWTFDPSTSTLTISAGTLAPRIPWNSNAFTGVVSDQIQTVIIEPGVIAPANMSNFFGWWTSLTEIQGGYNLDVSNVTDMQSMLSGATSLTTIDVSNWDVSNATNMDSMFQWNYSLTALDVSNWDTSNVTDMSRMFNGAESLITLDVSNWDTSNVTNMSIMFADAYSLTALDVSNWDTRNVIDMNNMFSFTESLITLDVSNWDTSSVTDIFYMFYGAVSLASLNLSNWDISNEINITSMLSATYFLQELTMGPNFKFDTLLSWDTARLPEANSFAPNPAIYTGLWINLDTGWTGTAIELMANYDGSSTATNPPGPGTYVWQRVDGIYSQLQREVIFTDGFNDPSIIVSNMPTNSNLQVGSNFTIPNITPQIQGYTFIGWRDTTINAILQPGDSITLNNNIILEAQWRVDQTTTSPIIVSLTDPEAPNAGYDNDLSRFINVYWIMITSTLALILFTGRQLLNKQR